MITELNKRPGPCMGWKSYCGKRKKKEKQTWRVKKRNKSKINAIDLKF
jgi:hypothetical protein